ncbi:MAG: hypothetical protein KBD78_09445 [Oligoflexales bacterium]|nr:hypothetical protein [Oligoflexales bacterium]
MTFSASNLSFVISFFFASGTLLAQTVSKISVKKNSVIVDSVFKKGSEVCIYESSKKIACGRVKSIKKSSSLINLSRGYSAKNVKEGMKVKEEAKEKKAQAEPAFKNKSKKKTTTSSKKFSRDRNFDFGLGFTPAFLAPYTFNQLTFKVPSGGAVDTLWESKATKSDGLISFGLNAGYYFNSNMGVGLGLRMRLPYEFSVDDDFSTDPTLWTRSETSFTGSSFNLVFTYIIDFSSTSFLKLNTGIDMESDTLEFKSIQLDDESADTKNIIASANGKLSIMSLRIDAIYSYFLLDSLSIDAGLGILLPLSVTESFAAEVNTTLAGATPSVDAATDLQKSLNFTKNSVGVELIFGTSMSL